MKRQEARIRAERLGTSQHGKEETRLTWIRDINERTATRAGDLGQVEGGVHVVMGERTQKDTQGWDHGEGDSGGMGGRQDWGPLQGGNLGMLLGREGVLVEGSSGQLGGEGVDPERRGCPREREAQEGLTGSILVHHAQPLCLVLSLEGIEIQDTEGKKGKMVKTC